MANDIDYLMFALNSTKPAERKKAILEIEKSGSTEAGKNLVPVLERDKDDSIKALAARVIGALGVKSAGEALIGAIRSGSEEASYFAAISLAQICSDGLIKRITDEMNNTPENNDRSFFWLTEALKKSGNAAISGIVDLLSIRSWSKRRILGDALISFGQEAEKHLINAIADENCDKRFWCAKILGRVGGSDAVNALIKYVDDDNNDVRTAVITALGEIGNKTAIEFLKKTLKSPKKELRHKSVEVLGKFGEEIVESLIESLSDDYWYVRDSACHALSKLGKKVIPYLANAYDTGNEDIRISAIKALSTLGEDAIDVLIHALGDRYEPICKKAADAIIKIGPFGIDALMAAYKKKAATDSVKRWIIYSLGEICDGPSNAAAAALITEALKSNDLVIRHTAATALKNFRTPRVINVLIGLLADIHEEVRESASKNLELMSKDSIPFLIESLSHENWVMRKNVAAVLGRIGNQSTPELLKVLQSGDEDARYWAIKAMGQIGSGAVEPLLQYLNDNSWQVRKNASDALAEIGEPVVKPLTAKLTRSSEGYGSNLFYWSEFILTKIGPAAHYPLMSLLNHSNENVRMLAATVIGKTSSTIETYQLLKDMLEEDDSFEVKKRIVQVIGHFPQPDVLDLLIDFYEKNENCAENLAPLVIDAISKIESKKTMDFLQKMLKSSSWISRYRATCALMDLSEKSYLDLDIEKVVALLNDEVTIVASSAAKFLASMKTEKAQISVVRLLKEKRFEETILEVLSKNSYFKSKDVIIPYLKSSDKNLRA
ncbi:MAG TPA: HEAT repeat domain-containing protein, partial [Candidatus Wallbacteria bacterium]|nr:HEAT repeat domain-containing protein [Candidatus Wallbacteria bacterium]